ncbi:MAG: LamG protein [Flavipsychrobacter sp.]|jgi:hypothetical protein|nr:LamG protein [Flavipsychrobacter sp.]
MKKLLLASLLIAGNIAFGQSTVGLIAHWDMNGSVTDVTGNLHNGTPHNLTPTTDRFGRPNSAYRFNGINSYVTAPYQPDLNLTNFTLCAIVKVIGYNAGTCEVNTVFDRGRELTSGSYSVRFYDNAYNGCGVLDTSKEVFTMIAGTEQPASQTDWQYTPNIVRNTWYKVVEQWDGTTFKIYVNGVLVNSVTSASGSMGTSMDSISMGKSVYNSASYPYYFNGDIDDIKIFNRLLTDSETVHYGDTCGVVTSSPASTSSTIGSTVTFTVGSSIIAASYQWQEDLGSGYTNLTSATPYSGVNTPTLTITGITASLHNARYRCVLSNTWVCEDTSSYAILSVYPLGVPVYYVSAEVRLFPNPAGSRLTIESSVPVTSLVITNILGKQVANIPARGDNTVHADVSGLPAGVYLLRINETEVRRFVKQ